VRRASTVPAAGQPGATVADTNVVFELWQLSRAANALLAGPLDEVGMNGDEFGVYSVLASAADGMTPGALARWMSAPPTTVSSYLRRLESRGHLVRRPDPADGRGSLVGLTATGRRAFRRAASVYEPVLAEVRQNLGASEPKVLAALVMLREAIDAARG
jgi:DNA-binding MarR family transcriptional regulator